MNLNFFQIIILLITLGTIVYFWKKAKILSNFLLGGIILTGLCCFDFLNFNGKLNTLTIFIFLIGYLLMNTTYFIYFFKKESKLHWFYSFSIFVLISLLCLFFVDYGQYYIFKFGIIIRLFFSFFPLYYFTVKKYSNVE